ncbi:hypothetical protein F4823DRAFT_584376 [Ustulina deusta]|nr:hypothetical protein F4823DRAFT_584376 [Ustulina deusta]
MAMDAVDKLFAAMLDPESTVARHAMSETEKLTLALREFTKEPPSQDIDYPYLLAHAQQACATASTTGLYFAQQLAHLAVHKPVSRKDKSQKARQLKFYRWVAHGMKVEMYPFATGHPHGPPSTMRIATLASPMGCAACGKTGANMRCPDCAFHDDGHILEMTSYCNKKCLNDHYDAHRSICEGRKMVFRAASLLDFMFVAMQEATYAYQLGKVFKKNGIVYLVDSSWDRAGMTGRRLFIPFPKHLTDSVEMQRSLVLWGQGGDVTLSSFPLIKYLFKPFCKHMELATIRAKNVLTPMCQLSSGQALNNCLHQHRVLRLTLMSDEQYVIDLTAAQFGWKETLAPWTWWAHLRASTVQYEPFKAANGKDLLEIQQSVVEAQQQEARVPLVRSIVKELETSLQANPSFHSFDKLLKSGAEDYKRAEYDIMGMVRQKIYMLVTNEFYKNTYRLWLVGAPSYGIQIAKEHAKVLKEVWMTGKEYDRLKNEGTDMRKLWSERIDGKIKQNLGIKGCAGTTGKCSHVHEAPTKQEGAP